MRSIFQVKNLMVAFNGVKVVRGIDLTLEKGEIISILGESGSGKTVTAMSLSRLYDQKIADISADQIRFFEQDLLGLSETALNQIRGKKIAYIFQNPVEALSPNMRIEQQFIELCRLHGVEVNLSFITEVLLNVGLNAPEIILKMYPHQLSGGQAQRVVIALALLLKPDVLVADEPTSSIDASLTEKIVELLLEINQKYGIAIIFITHDFDLAARISHEMIIMYGGLVMEKGKRDVILSNPLHPYTVELMKCVKSIHSSEKTLYTLQGNAKDPRDFLDECPFFDRCDRRLERCGERIPSMNQYEGRDMRCVHYE